MSIDQNGTAPYKIILLTQFLDVLGQKNVRVDLVFPPIYLNGYNQRSKDAFNLKKERFYRILSESTYKIKGKPHIFDCSEKFFDRKEYFCDLTNLNKKGARQFTQMINELILDKHDF